MKTLQLAQMLYRQDKKVYGRDLTFSDQVEYVARAFDVQLAKLQEDVQALKSRQFRAETRREDA